MTPHSSLEIVLVHGGFSDGSVWSKVISILQRNGYSVSASQLPLTSFEEDVASVRRHLAFKNQPALLVGHSYGGAVITEAATSDLNVKGCVYLAGTVPALGEVYGAFMGQHPGEYRSSLAPDSNGFVWADSGVIADGLAQDVSPEERNLMLAVQKPISVRVYGGVISNEGWRNRKTWYVVAENDRLFPPATQRALADRIDAEVISLTGGHMLPLSQPDRVAKVLMDAAMALRS